MPIQQKLTPPVFRFLPVPFNVGQEHRVDHHWKTHGCYYEIIGQPMVVIIIES